eukprot:5265631-Amphidinium_carterae.1
MGSFGRLDRYGFVLLPTALALQSSLTDSIELVRGSQLMHDIWLLHGSDGCNLDVLPEWGSLVTYHHRRHAYAQHHVALGSNDARTCAS